MTDATIVDVHGRRVWDSRGRPTVETEITLASGLRARAIAPAGASTGTGEALDLRDGGRAFAGLGVGRALAAVNGEIAALLKGMDARDQAGIDDALIHCDGTSGLSRLGGNAVVATSMAVLQAAAAAAGLPILRSLAGARRDRLGLGWRVFVGGHARKTRRRRASPGDYLCIGMTRQPKANA